MREPPKQRAIDLADLVQFVKVNPGSNLKAFREHFGWSASKTTKFVGLAMDAKLIRFERSKAYANG